MSVLPGSAQAGLNFGTSTWANEPASESERTKVRHERDLMRSILNGNSAEFQRILTEQGKNINISVESSGKMTPLHTAAAHGKVDMVASLIGKKASLEAVNSLGFTPLMSAVVNGHEACVKALVSAGASKSAKTARGETPASIAKAKGFGAIANLL